MRFERAGSGGAATVAARVAVGVVGVLTLAPLSTEAQEPPTRERESYSLYGTTGLIDTPSARMQPDGQMALTAGWFGPFLRNTYTFQALPRVEASFRYSILDDFFASGEDLFDRSFDVKVLLSDETPMLPAIAFGLQDFLGTGIYSAEYFVGSKRLGPFDVTAGFGWGRFAGLNGVPNPFCELRDGLCEREGAGRTGDVRFGNFFRGEDIGFFGGVEWRPESIPGLSVKAEYSSDDYSRDRRFNDYDMEIPFNFGVEYLGFPNVQLGAYFMHGATVGLRASFALNPFEPAASQDADVGPLPLRPRPPLPSETDPALGPVVEAIGEGPPLGSDAAAADAALAAAASGARWAEAEVDAAPGDACPLDAARAVDATLGVVDGVTLRAASGAPVCSVILRPGGRAFVAARTRPLAERDLGWHDDPDQRAAAEARVAATLEADRLELERLALTPTSARLEIANPTYNAAPQAIGRAATALANELPPSVERFEIVLIEGSLPAVSVHLTRARLEAAAETADEAREVYLGAEITDPALDSVAPLRVDPSFPRFSWFLSPALPVSLFDPDQPVRADLRLRVGAGVELTRGLSVSGTVRKRVIGSLDQITRESDSVLPRVRSDFRRYLDEGDPGIERLTGDWLFKLRPDTYGRLSAGYLESMFGGVSGEVLWKPATQDWGLGLEVNYARQRDFDMRFGFQDYDVATGHASLYWDTGWQGMEVQVDGGRYLAGDWGGTFSLTRRFANGWEVGGFFTLTDVPFDEFGEGSFDKGLTLRVPLRWGLPYETRSAFATTVRPVTRDGGQRLEIANRLYGFVQDLDRGGLRDDWGTFWK